MTAASSTRPAHPRRFVFGAAFVALGLGLSPPAVADPKWDEGAYDKCVEVNWDGVSELGAQGAMLNCCIVTGGSLITNPDGSVVGCEAPKRDESPNGPQGNTGKPNPVPPRAPQSGRGPTATTTTPAPSVVSPPPVSR